MRLHPTIRESVPNRPFGLFVLMLAFLLIVPAGCRTTPDPQTYKAPEGATAKSGRPYVFLTATEMAEAVRNGSVTSEQLVRAHLDHIHLHNPALNAIVTLDEQRAMERARQADAALARGETPGPLHGVPITIKDHFAVKGMRTTNAFPPLAGQITDYDATVVRRLEDAGAIVLGKTNLPVLAMDTQTHNPIFGTTNNPWDLSRTPGGSTGGGAAAVAAGMSALEIGSDIGGSIRIPAHFCGIYGIKTTENTISAYGSFPGLFDARHRSVRYMASMGPLARSVADLRLALSIIAGPDASDATATPLVQNDGPERACSDLRIAWTDGFGDVPVTADTRHVMAAFAEKLTGAGCTVRRVAPNLDFNEVWKTWGQMMDVQTGMRQPGWARLLIYSFGGLQRAKSPLLQMVFPIGHEDYIEILSRRDHIISNVDRFLADWDVFICPVATRPAIAHYPPDDVKFNYSLYYEPIAVDDHQLNYWTALAAYTAPFNVTGHPVVTLPAGYSEDGMPIGIQIVGKRWHDLELLDIAEVIDAAAGAYRPPEGY